MKCPKCESEKVHKDGNYRGYQRYRCLSCGNRFSGEKYDGDNQYIIHFKTRIKKSERNCLTRDNYCTPSNECSYKVKKNLRFVKNYYEQHHEYPSLAPSYYCDIPNKYFADEEHYTDEYVEKHTKDCIDNYDLNMHYFNSLNHAEFDKCLLKTVKKFKLTEIENLDCLKDASGIYMLVLDKYKQVYIGQSDNIKRRILQHWSKKKEFDHLLCGAVNTSILSIDSFGALDTTRIFYKPASWRNIHTLEQEIMSHLDKKYRLNRVSGGLNDVDFPELRNLMLMSSMQTREM